MYVGSVKLPPPDLLFNFLASECLGFHAICLLQPLIWSSQVHRIFLGAIYFDNLVSIVQRILCAIFAKMLPIPTIIIPLRKQLWHFRASGAFIASISSILQVRALSWDFPRIFHECHNLTSLPLLRMRVTTGYELRNAFRLSGRPAGRSV